MLVNSITLGWGLLLMLVGLFIYDVFIYYNDTKPDLKDMTDMTEMKEGFYPRHWWGPGYGYHRGWRHPWLRGWGNWRPYGYYPAYSGYWKQCENGTWCPSNISCSSIACQ